MRKLNVLILMMSIAVGGYAQTVSEKLGSGKADTVQNDREKANPVKNDSEKSDSVKIISYENGDRYEGGMVNNQREGYGVLPPRSW